MVDNRIWRCEMTDEEWVVVDEVAGDLQGEILADCLKHRISGSGYPRKVPDIAHTVWVLVLWVECKSWSPPLPASAPAQCWMIIMLACSKLQSSCLTTLLMPENPRIRRNPNKQTMDKPAATTPAGLPAHLPPRLQNAGEGQQPARYFPPGRSPDLPPHGHPPEL